MYNGVMHWKIWDLPGASRPCWVCWRGQEVLHFLAGSRLLQWVLVLREWPMRSGWRVMSYAGPTAYLNVRC